MSIVKKKVSQLPVADSIQGLKAFGVDSGNRSVQIPLEFVKNAADNAEAKGDYAKEKADEIIALPMITARVYSEVEYEI